PGVVYDGDDIGTWRWRQQEPGTWAQLLPEQRERLTALGVRGAALPVAAAAPAELRPALTAALKGPKKAGSKAEAAFQRGLAALTRWVEKEGQRPIPRGAVVEIAVDGEADPVPVKLGVWLSNTKSRRDKLTAAQLAALRKLGIGWA
ncbi:helicase associated domain-containing protein, partial [Streptomyces sp. NPDC056638]|uniref:helicase associated domain-containing protein n=1 Tax=Streptomyces sp. NPDC056638 TaxID=3345887 RepID=UPI0036756E02